jgi:hypothetical protein
VRPRKDKRSVDLISDALPFGRLWYDTPDHAIGYAMHYSRSHDAVMRVYDAADNVIKTHEHKGEFSQRVGGKQAKVFRNGPLASSGRFQDWRVEHNIEAILRVAVLIGQRDCAMGFAVVEARFNFRSFDGSAGAHRTVVRPRKNGDEFT